MKVEKSKISELIKELQRITICAGPCVSRAREYPRGLQRRNGKAVSPKLRNAFQEFEEYNEMIRFAIERGGFFFFWPMWRIIARAMLEEMRQVGRLTQSSRPEMIQP